MANDGFVQVPADSVGKLIDTETVNQPGSTQTFQRQRVSIPEVVEVHADTLDLILRELKAISLLLASAFGLDANDFRSVADEED